MAVETRKYCSGSITVTPFGVDCRRFIPERRSHSQENEFIVGTVKALEGTYGIEYLIRSFALVERKWNGRRKLRLIIVGDGPLRRSLEQLVGDLGLSNQVSFVGGVPHSQVPELLNTFSVFCALSLRESFGVAVLEASACGIPVVVTNVGGLPEIVQNGVTGLIVPPKDIGAVAGALEKLIEDEPFRRTLGAAGRKLVLENYEWSENATRMEGVYRALVGVN